MKDFRIEIAKPCRAGWENMEQAEKGRFCGECSKIVIDFTAMTQEQIKAYFLNHRDQKICGHFISSQLKQYNAFQLSLIGLHKRAEKIPFRIPRIAACGLMITIMSLSGCSGHTKGEPEVVDGGITAYYDSTEVHTEVDSVSLRGSQDSINSIEIKR